MASECFSILVRTNGPNVHRSLEPIGPRRRASVSDSRGPTLLSRRATRAKATSPPSVVSAGKLVARPSTGLSNRVNAILGSFKRQLTGDVVAEYPRRDDPAKRAEQVLQVLLRHALRQTTDVQVRAFDRLAARSRVRYLRRGRIRSV